MVVVVGILQSWRVCDGVLRIGDWRVCDWRLRLGEGGCKALHGGRGERARRSISDDECASMSYYTPSTTNHHHRTPQDDRSATAYFPRGKPFLVQLSGKAKERVEGMKLLE